MKRKNFLLNLLAMMMVAMVSVSFMSCKDDDEENSIVGTWELTDDNERIVVTFRANGTGTWTEYLNGELDEVENFTYQYDEKSKLLVAYFGDEAETGTVTINGDIMYWGGEVFRRIN